MEQKYIIDDVIEYDNKIMVIKEPRDGNHFDLFYSKVGVIYCFIDINKIKPVKIIPKILSANGFKIVRQDESGIENTEIYSSHSHVQIGSSGDSTIINTSGKHTNIGSSGDCANISSLGGNSNIGSLGDLAKINSLGAYTIISSFGNNANITSSGMDTKVSSMGKDSIIICTGKGSMVKAEIGSWITLVEYKWDDSKGHFTTACVKTEYVDGERIKANTWYKLLNGIFVKKYG